MRIYDVYEHPDFELSSKEVASSRTAICRMAGALSTVVASSIVVYYLMASVKAMPTAFKWAPETLR